MEEGEQFNENASRKTNPMQRGRSVPASGQLPRPQAVHILAPFLPLCSLCGSVAKSIFTKRTQSKNR